MMDDDTVGSGGVVQNGAASSRPFAGRGRLPACARYSYHLHLTALLYLTDSSRRYGAPWLQAAVSALRRVASRLTANLAGAATVDQLLDLQRQMPLLSCH